mmetsp:Transcript_24374/g.37579  ORF Transcript_24374/g.37579 Transcript_24374/m.37579 type:complete len:370 (+) Transcript_24374:5047-6156(+)
MTLFFLRHKSANGRTDGIQQREHKDKGNKIRNGSIKSILLVLSCRKRYITNAALCHFVFVSNVAIVQNVVLNEPLNSQHAIVNVLARTTQSIVAKVWRSTTLLKITLIIVQIKVLRVNIRAGSGLTDGSGRFFRIVEISPVLSQRVVILIVHAKVRIEDDSHGQFHAFFITRPCDIIRHIIFTVKRTKYNVFIEKLGTVSSVQVVRKISGGVDETNLTHFTQRCRVLSWSVTPRGITADKWVGVSILVSSDEPSIRFEVVINVLFIIFYKLFTEKTHTHALNLEPNQPIAKGQWTDHMGVITNFSRLDLRLEAIGILHGDLQPQQQEKEDHRHAELQQCADWTAFAVDCIAPEERSAGPPECHLLGLCC